MKKKINIISLGCSKNLVDSEKLMAQLERSGFEVVFDSNDTSAKIVIINTCGFIADAKEESLDTILSFAYAKKEGVIEELYVVGCLSERYRDQLITEIPEADGFFGVNDIYDVLERLGSRFREELLSERHLTTPSHYAYLKISEGCNWRCSYCAIPGIRGEHRSVPIEQLTQEAERLAQKGVKELLLVAQDLTYYGLDLYGKRALADLLRELVKIEGIEWIRLHYAYPAFFPKEVIELMASEEKLCKYLDIPFQHINSEILESMRRGIDSEQTKELIRYFRKTVPSIALRTTLIVGYPGETEERFKELCEFVKETKFERLGVFAYCSEEDTFAGENLKDEIDQKTKQRRVDKIMSIQTDLVEMQSRRFIGQEIRVLLDRFEDGMFIGRSQYDSPEVDGEVIIASDYDLQIGEFYDALITKTDGYDLYAEVK